LSKEIKEAYLGRIPYGGLSERPLHAYLTVEGIGKKNEKRGFLFGQ